MAIQCRHIHVRRQQSSVDTIAIAQERDTIDHIHTRHRRGQRATRCRGRAPRDQARGRRNRRQPHRRPGGAVRSATPPAWRRRSVRSPLSVHLRSGSEVRPGDGRVGRDDPGGRGRCMHDWGSGASGPTATHWASVKTTTRGGRKRWGSNGRICRLGRPPVGLAPPAGSGSIHCTVPPAEWPSDLRFVWIAKIVGQEVHSKYTDP